MMNNNVNNINYNYNGTDDVAHDNKLALIWCILSGSSERIRYHEPETNRIRIRYIDTGATVEDAIRKFGLERRGNVEND